MKIAFDCRGTRWIVACHPADAPRTLAALDSHLPMPLQLHTPKIAGSHIYWHAPFVEAAEGAIDVLQARPGAFIYWPERQFLEITFAPLQAETASITVLGHLEGGLDALVDLGLALRAGHGRERFDGMLSLIDGEAPRPAGIPCPEVGGLADVRARREAIWAAAPADLAVLLGSRAIMHPAGPLFLAESEARGMHEMLWWHRARLGAAPEDTIRFSAALTCNKAATRLRDFCHLGESAALLFDLERLFHMPDIPLAALLDEAILVAGRLAAWLDLAIPWSNVNAAVRAVLDEPRVRTGDPGNGENTR